MRKTGKEIASVSDASPGGKAEMDDWLFTASPREIQQYIHSISIDAHNSKYQLARIALEIRLAEDAADAACILERHTRKLICLTWALLALTAFLLVSAIWLAIRH